MIFSSTFNCNNQQLQIIEMNKIIIEYLTLSLKLLTYSVNASTSSQGRKSMFKHGGDNIGVNIHPACGMYGGARSAALL